MKVEYEINMEAQRPATLILAGCIIITIILSAFLVREQSKVKNYATVEATIIEIIKRETSMSELEDVDYNYFVRYTYTFEKKEYVSERQEVSLRGKYVGKKVLIQVSTKEPSKIQNIHNINALFSGIIICVIFEIILIWFLIEVKKENRRVKTEKIQWNK